MRNCKSAPDDFEVIVDFRQRADRRSCGAHVIFLFNRNRRENAIDRINFRLVHAIEKLSHIRGESFHVATLSFGIERMKSERRLAGTRGPGDDRELAVCDIEIEPL